MLSTLPALRLPLFPRSLAPSWPRASRWIALAFCAAITGGCASLPSNVTRPVSMAIAPSTDTQLGAIVQARRTAAGGRNATGFRLLDSIESAYGSRLALIDAAQKTLDLQYYAIHADSSTEKLLEHLRSAAQRGVRVRILIDDFNTAGADAQVLRLAFEPGIQVRLFNPLPGSRSSMFGRILGSLNDIQRIQQRMHNKLFIADNAMGITGGRNLGDSYFGQDQGSNFIDLDILAAGPIVRDMSESFDRYWNNDQAYPVGALMTEKELNDLRTPPRANGAQPPASAASAGAGEQPVVATPTAEPSRLPGIGSGGGSVLPGATPTVALDKDGFDLRRVTLTWAPATLMVDKPGKIGPDEDEVDAQDTLVDGLLQLMSQARSDLLIVSPYFVPGKEMMKTFATLRARGVHIRVLTNSLASNDAPAAHAGYARYRKQLLGMGIELYETRAMQEGEAKFSFGSSGGSSSGSSSKEAAGSGSGGSRASLHAKVLVMDSRLIVIGSMNLDLRSQLQNTEVALLIRSASLAKEATRQIEPTLTDGAYRVELVGGNLVWHAPKGSGVADATSEPDASLKLKLLVDVISPFAPEEML